MRNHYQRRSLASIFIWSTALAAISLVAAWQFHWWPTTETEQEALALEAKSDPQAAGIKNPIQQASHETPAEKPDPVEDLFSQQTEPDLPDLPAELPPFDPAKRPDFSDFPKPPQLLPANPDAKPVPLPSRLVQTVEGELPPWQPNAESPGELSAKAPIQLLKEETSQAKEPVPAVLPPEMAAVAGKIEQIDAWMESSNPSQELAAHKNSRHCIGTTPNGGMPSEAASRKRPNPSTLPSNRTI